MAESLTPISSMANSSPTDLVALVNSIVGILASDVVTANNSANGGLTIGNSYVSGILGASILVAGILRGGNVQSSANLIINSNTFINSASLYIGNSTVNAAMTSVMLSINSIAVNTATVGFFPQANLTFANASIAEVDLVTTTAGAAVLDSFPLSTYQSVEYTVQVTDTTANNFQVSKILALHSGGAAFSTEYALLASNNTIATFSVSVNSTAFILTTTTTPTNTTIRVLRKSLKP